MEMTGFLIQKVCYLSRVSINSAEIAFLSILLL